MPNSKSKSKSSSNSKLNVSIDTFANSPRDMIDETVTDAVTKTQENTVGPIMDLIIETREELKKDYNALIENMNTRFEKQDKKFSAINEQLS